MQRQRRKSIWMILYLALIFIMCLPVKTVMAKTYTHKDKKTVTYYAYKSSTNSVKIKNKKIIVTGSMNSGIIMRKHIKYYRGGKHVFYMSPDVTYAYDNGFGDGSNVTKDKFKSKCLKWFFKGKGKKAYPVLVLTVEKGKVKHIAVTQVEPEF